MIPETTPDLRIIYNLSQNMLNRTRVDGPYEIISRKSKGHYREVLLGSYEDYKLKYGKFNFTHVIEDKRIPHGYFAYHGIKPSKFLDYIYDINGCIYDKGEVGVWHL